MDFVHLRNRTHYSFGAGVLAPPALAERAVALGMKAVAITDTGGLFGAVEFYRACRTAGVKPILGLSVLLANEGGPVASRGARATLLAENASGWRNLMRVSSECCRESATHPAPVACEFLASRAEGLICLLSAMRGDLDGEPAAGPLVGTEATAAALIDVFSRDHLYLELENHGLPDEVRLIPKAIELGQGLGVSLVAVNDSLFLEPADAQAYSLVSRARSGDASSSGPSPDACEPYHFRSGEEMAALWRELPEAILNTVEIAERCNVALEGDPLLPRAGLPDGCAAAGEHLARLCREGLKERNGPPPAEYEQRLAMELAVIQSRGCEDYFLEVHDYISAARRMGIMTWDRGSAGGSLVNYALGITTTDPIAYGLIFERFLNPERSNWPDIDIDVASEGRSRLLDYLSGKYGSRNVAQVASVYRIGKEEAARGVAESSGCSESETRQFVCSFLAEDGPEPDNEEKLLLFGAARMLAGTPTHIGAHPCGVVVAPGEVADLAPLSCLSTEGLPLTQFDTRSVEFVGLTKFDLIGSKTLSLAADVLEVIHKRHGQQIDLARVPEDDTRTYELLGRAHTAGVFQFGSEGVRNCLKQIRPASIEHLAALLAAYRPASAEQLVTFAARRNGHAPVPQVHPDFDAVVRDTYGLLIFQEQVMEIAREMGKLSLAEADLCRRAIGKKRQEETDDYRGRFVAGATRDGVPEDVAHEAYSMLESAGYVFNRSHAVTYARLAYRLAFLKAHFPVEFSAALLNTYAGHPRMLDHVLDEAADSGLRILPPDINAAEAECTIQDGAVRLGLLTIRRGGPALASAILKSREAGGPFSDLFDCCSRLPDGELGKEALASLVASGALDALPGTRAQKFAAIRPPRWAADRREGVTARGANADLPDEVESFDLVREIASVYRGRVKDLSFDIYCPKTYTHHARFTLWLPPETVIFDLDPSSLMEHGRALVGSLGKGRNEEYVIGLNSRVDQYSERHLLMLDLDSVDGAAISLLKEHRGHLLKSGRGFHFIGRALLPTRDEWEAQLRALQASPALAEHIDRRHVEMSLKRGYSTLRILESPAKPERPTMVMLL